MKLFWKSILSLMLAMLLFEGMVTAFHLLNLPSTLAVIAGLCLLLILAAGGVLAYRFLWRRL